MRGRSARPAPMASTLARIPAISIGRPSAAGRSRCPPRSSARSWRTRLRRSSPSATGAARAVTHVKPHGALYNQAASDLDLALAVAEAVREQSTTLRFVGLAGSRCSRRAVGAGLPVAPRRSWIAPTSLTDRSCRAPSPAPCSNGPEAAVRQALTIVRGHYVNATDGSRIAIDADTLCLHGDTPGALAIAKAVRHALEAAAHSRCRAPRPFSIARLAPPTDAWHSSRQTSPPCGSARLDARRDGRAAVLVRPR